MDLIGKYVAIDKCSGCYSCQNICPKGAITMREYEDTFLYPTIDQDKCIDCNACITACPAVKERESIQLRTPICYASWNSDSQIVEDSSSGGVFSAMAEVILKSNGYVYGALFDDKLSLYHKEVSIVDELSQLRGSKYVQSNINSSFRKAEKRLKAGALVLFIGTPCQIAGLNTFLKKDYHNLITCDFICHGVPSQSIFDKYIKDLEISKEVEVSDFKFRCKKESWKDFNIKISYKNNAIEEIPFPQNSYMNGFLADIYLRPSCYQCKYSRLPRVADISLADYWGVWDVMPEIYNKRGVSAVLINSEKGKSFFNSLRNLTKHEISLNSIKKGNPGIDSSARLHKKRNLFYKLYYKQNNSFQKIIEQCLPPPTYFDKLMWSFNRRLKKIRKE